MKEIDKWKLEEKLGIKGWNFDHLDNRWFNEPLPWNYLKLVLKYLKPNMQLLDMGTGGGELLKKFNHPAKNTQVTEAWEPNIKLLKQTLAIEGVRVIENEHEADIPVADNSLDMITNSHAAFDAELVKQKLKQNGLFIIKIFRL
ncbi:methyltransferase domain-containing protein [Fructilactobacillus sanfranciscensis]|uniref:methyltransferase domain-containing protein n=2 Tax=Fructilactobacillus sanfranciscensis TaxID=1625 RepID=UPI001CDC6898|nr:methyltransferase domain-containing protein [Fructilactobacillus sanfranciscensis]